MKKCLICGKFIWFFQSKVYSLDKEEVLIHKKCYLKQSPKEKNEIK